MLLTLIFLSKVSDVLKIKLRKRNSCDSGAVSIRFPATKGMHLYCFVVSRTPGFEVSYLGAGIGIVHSRYDHMKTVFPRFYIIPVSRV